MKRMYHVIGACSCWGAQLRACEGGPEDLADGSVFERLKKAGASLESLELLYPAKQAKEEEIPMEDSLSLIKEFNLQLTQAVKKTIQKEMFPVVIGGDHSIAVGTWNGFEKPFGLLWIDAHMDAHTPETSPSGAFHGMPVAALLGAGALEMAQLVHKTAVLQPKNLALIGVRSFEKEEADFLKNLNVKIYFMEEIKKRGLKEILSEAIAHVCQGVSGYGVSLDLDAIDLHEAPGVGSPEPGGLEKDELLRELARIGKDKRLIGFELVEFNPEKDISHKTRETAFEILKEVMC
jgi:arginase